MVSRVLRVHLDGKVIEVTTGWTVFPVVLDRKVNRDETGQWAFQACEDLLVHPGYVFIYSLIAYKQDRKTEFLEIFPSYFYRIDEFNELTGWKGYAGSTGAERASRFSGAYRASWRRRISRRSRSQRSHRASRRARLARYSRPGRFAGRERCEGRAWDHGIPGADGPTGIRRPSGITRSTGLAGREGRLARGECRWVDRSIRG